MNSLRRPRLLIHAFTTAALKRLLTYLLLSPSTTLLFLHLLPLGS
jgi:hypothetical protein